MGSEGMDNREVRGSREGELGEGSYGRVGE